VFLCTEFTLRPVYDHQHKLEAGMYHLISRPPGLPELPNDIFYSKVEKQWR